MLVFDYLTAADIECRVSTVTDKGCSLLLYKDARCDMRLLDITVGTENWQREHYECKGNLFCRVGINVNFSDINKPAQWVYKSDCGTESYSEKEKGEASDSFKRACFNWGIGRELYTAPFIWIGADKCTIVPSNNGKFTTYDRFVCTYVRVENGKITAINIENAKTHKTVYVYGDILKKDTVEVCAVCKKHVSTEFAEKSKAANNGVVYCSGTCVKKDIENELTT